MFINIVHLVNILLSSINFTNLPLLIKCQCTAGLKSALCSLFKLFKIHSPFSCNSNVATTFQCDLKYLLQRLNPIWNVIKCCVIYVKLRDIIRILDFYQTEHIWYSFELTQKQKENKKNRKTVFHECSNKIPRYLPRKIVTQITSKP